jgi:hypothetical protein
MTVLQIPRILLCAGLACAGLGLAACSFVERPGPTINRPDGEGFAGRGELVVRVSMPGATSGVTIPGLTDSRPERASIELRYLGIDSTGRAVFERHDVDKLAGAAAPVPAVGTEAESGAAPADQGLAPDTRLIALDLRLTRQIHMQGKIIEVVEATPSGVVFRIY